MLDFRKSLNKLVMEDKANIFQRKDAVVTNALRNIKGSVVMQKIHLLMGVVIIFVGIFWPYVSRIPLGKLPLDVDLKLGNIQFYLPIGSSVLFSFVLTILLNLLK